MLSPPSFILPIIVERLILGGLWFHIKLDRDLFTRSTKLVRTLRTEEMKITFERAKLLTMVIFPKGIKSLEDKTLRHFSRATNFFSKLSFLKLLHHMRFVSHELSWQRGVVFFSEMFSLDFWYRVSLALGPGVPPSPPPQKKRELQGFRWMFGTQDSSRYNYYVDNWLSFGLFCDPPISNAIVRMMARYGFHAMINYLDDFLFIRSTRAECQMGLVTLISLLHSLGFNVWAGVKSFLLLSALRFWELNLIPHLWLFVYPWIN